MQIKDLAEVYCKNNNDPLIQNMIHLLSYFIWVTLKSASFFVKLISSTAIIELPPRNILTQVTNAVLCFKPVTLHTL